MAALEEAEQATFGKLGASKLVHKHHDRSRTWSKSKIVFLLSHSKICGGRLSCKGGILHCSALDFDMIQRAPRGGHDVLSAALAFEEAGLHAAFDAFNNNNKISKMRDRSLYSALPL